MLFSIHCRFDCSQNLYTPSLAYLNFGVLASVIHNLYRFFSLITASGALSQFPPHSLEYLWGPRILPRAPFFLTPSIAQNGPYSLSIKPSSALLITDNTVISLILTEFRSLDNAAKFKLLRWLVQTPRFLASSAPSLTLLTQWAGSLQLSETKGKRYGFWFKVKLGPR